MQSVGGAMILVAWIALWILSTSSRPISLGRRVGRHAGALADLGAGAGGDAAEIAGEAGAQVAGLGVPEHLHQHAELDAVGVGLDLRRLLGDLLRHPRKDVLGAVLLRLGRDVGDLGVRVRQGDLADVGVDGVLAAAVGRPRARSRPACRGPCPTRPRRRASPWARCVWCRSRARSGAPSSACPSAS